MPRDVAPRTLPADPTEDLHAATKQYVDNQIGGGAWPVEIAADGYATILYVVGTMKIGVWYGVVTGDGDPVTIIPDDANDVSRLLTFQSAVWLGSGDNYYRRRSYDTDTLSDESATVPLTPGGDPVNLLYVHAWGEYPERVLELVVNADGSADIVTIADGATYYVGLQLMWF
jgi:hypothetical protein